MAVSPGGNTLYIANSDFDLQFNSGTVTAIDLVNLRSVLEPLFAPAPPADPTNPPDPCIDLGLGHNPNPTLQPGNCGPVDLAHPPGGVVLVGPSVKIGAFATDLIYVCRPTDDLTAATSGAPSPGFGRSRCRGVAPDLRGARLFLPVRGDPSLTFIDVDDDRGMTSNHNPTFNCDQDTNNGRCASSHRSGVDSNDNTRGLTMPAEPFGIAVSDRVDAIAVTHETGGAVSLFTGVANGAETVLDGKPTLQFVFGGVPAATGVVALPLPAALLRELVTENARLDALGEPPLTLSQWLAATNYQQGFGVAYRGAAEIDVFRFFDDKAAAPLRPFLARSSARGFDVVPSGQDSRDIVLDDSERMACATACPSGAPSGPALDACIEACEQIPLAVFLTNRAPSSLLVGQVLPANSSNADESLAMFDAVPLPTGPSRVVLGRIHDRRDPPGVDRPRVFAISFDARQIVVYDPIEHRVDGQIRTGRGPHALVMDPVMPIAYVSHFTDSYIGLVDLDQSHDDTFESIVATIGIPAPPRESN